MPDAPSRLHHLVPLLTAQGVGFACGTIGVRWSSAVLTPELLGTYTLLISTHTLAAFVTHQGMVQHVQRCWSTQISGRRYLPLLLGAWREPTWWLVAALGGIWLLLSLNSDKPVGWAWWPWMVVINLLALGAHASQAALQAEQRYWAQCAMSAVGSITRSFLPLLLVTAGTMSLATLGGGFVLHTLAWLAAGLAVLTPVWNRREGIDVETIESPHRMIRAFLGVGICGWVAGNSTRWVAALAFTPETAGYFMLALNLASLVPAAVSVVGLSYTFPPLFAAARAGATEEDLTRMTTRDVFRALGLGQLALLLLAWSGPFLVGPIIDQRYAPSISWLLTAGGGALTTVSASFYCQLLVARNRETACFRLLLISTAFRLMVMTALVLPRNEDLFRAGLTVLAWPTFLLERQLVRKWMQTARTP